MISNNSSSLKNGIILNLFRSLDRLSKAFRSCYIRIGCKAMAFIFDAQKKSRRIETDYSCRGLSKGRGIEKSVLGQLLKISSFNTISGQSH